MRPYSEFSVIYNTLIQHNILLLICVLSLLLSFILLNGSPLYKNIVIYFSSVDSCLNCYQFQGLTSKATKNIFVKKNEHHNSIYGSHKLFK